MDIKKLHLHWRESHYKGKKYRSYSLAIAFREEGKNKREVILKLGKLNDDEVLKWKNILAGIKIENSFITTASEITINKTLDFLDIFVANFYFDKLGMADVLHINKDVKIDLKTLLKILVINRCVDPVSKIGVPKWACKTFINELLGFSSQHLNPSRIYRELSKIENFKEALSFDIYNKLKKENRVNVVFYDLSTSTFFGNKCPIIDWGFSKDGYSYHAVFALVVNHEGIPFHWEVLPGCTSEATTMKNLLDRFKNKFNLFNDNISMIFDRGLVSEKNLSLLEKNNVKYISCLDQNQIEKSLVKEIDFHQFTDFNIENVKAKINGNKKFIKYQDNAFFYNTETSDGRRLILVFNPDLFVEQRKARMKIIENLKSYVEDSNKVFKSATQHRTRDKVQAFFDKEIDKQKVSNYVEIRLELINVKLKNNSGKGYSVHSFIGEVLVSEPNMALAGRMDGFWLMITNHTELNQSDDYKLSGENIIKQYREKNIIEMAFRDLKSCVNLSPVFLWTEAHIKAHYTICVLSYLINKTISLELKKNMGNISKEIITTSALMDELAKCKINELEIKSMNKTWKTSTKLSAIQIELLERLNIPISAVQSCIFS